MQAKHDSTPNGGGPGQGGGKGKPQGGRGQGKGGRRQGRGKGRGGGRVILNGVDVTDPKQTFSKEEWNKLKGQWQYIWDKRAGRAPTSIPGQGRGNGQGGQGAQLRSVQALQQVSSLLSEVAGTLAPTQESNGTELTADAGNSFGEASYGGRGSQVQFEQRLPQAMGIQEASLR